MSIVTVSKRIELDYGHTLPNHYSFCNQLHGHRGFVEAYVTGVVVDTPGDSSQGMVLDFTILKKTMMDKVHGLLDHGFAVWKDDKEDLDFVVKRNTRFLITNEPPTAEFLVKWAYSQIVSGLPSALTLDKVIWYETPTSAAYYTREDWLEDTVLKITV